MSNSQAQCNHKAVNICWYVSRIICTGLPILSVHVSCMRLMLKKCKLGGGGGGGGKNAFKLKQASPGTHKIMVDVHSVSHQSGMFCPGYLLLKLKLNLKSEAVDTY